MNPNLKLLTKFVSYSETVKVKILKECGCIGEVTSRHLVDSPVMARCFSWDFDKVMKKHYPKISYTKRPKHSREVITFECNKGHRFRQSVKCKMYLTHDACPRCSEILNAKRMRKAKFMVSDTKNL